MEKKGFDFEIPSLQEKRWLKVIDTALRSPMDIVEPGKEKVVPRGVCHVKKHSVVVLISG
jgi:glycogen operon protein